MLLLPGLKVVEVAHDFQQQIKNYITKDLKMINSYDTWHGKYMFYVLCMVVFSHYNCFFYVYT